MTGLDLANELRDSNTKIRGLQRKLNELTAQSESTGGFNYSNERVQTSPKPDAGYTSIIEEKADLQSQIYECVEIRKDLRKSFDRILMTNDFTEEEYEALYGHFYLTVDWWWAANILQCSIRTVKRRYKKGCEKLQDIVVDELD